MREKYIIIRSMDINDFTLRVNEAVTLMGAKLIGGVATQGAMLMQAITYEDEGTLVEDDEPIENAVLQSEDEKKEENATTPPQKKKKSSVSSSSDKKKESEKKR